MLDDTILPPGDERRPAVLYTPELLALTIRLAGFPFNPAHPRQSEARSRVCGSVVGVSLAVDRSSRIDAVGLRIAACAVGQAAAALFAQDAVGKTAGDLISARAAIAEWLASGVAIPSWPGLPLLQPALPHKARHAAILLPWDAAISALSDNGRRG